MKSLEQIDILNYLSEQVWNTATGLLDVEERFNRYIKAEGEKRKDFYWTDAVGQLEMWRTLLGDHSKKWEESLNEIDLEEVNIELLDDCPDNNTLQNRLRIVKNRYFGTWEITKYDEKQEVFNKLLHIVDKLTDILFNVYEWTEKEAHRKAVQWHDYIIQRWLNVEQLQRYMQGVIDNAEKILNPQSDTTNEQEQTVKSHTSLLDDEEIKEVFNAFVEKDYMAFNGNYYHWNKSPHLLAYFCEKVSLYFLNSTKTYDGKDATEWKQFEGIFEIEIKGKLEYPNNDRLRAYKNNWYRGKDRKKTPFLPNGYKGVEDILADLH